MNETKIQTSKYNNGYIQLRIDYKNEPIELAELAKCLSALASYYKRYTQQEGSMEEAVLLVESISEGSIIFEFVTSAIQITMPIVGMLTTIVSFGKIFISILEKTKKGEELKDRGTKTDSSNYKDISKTVGMLTVKDSKLEINVGHGGQFIVNNTVNSEKALVIQKNLDKRIKEIDVTRPTKLNLQTFYWYQARSVPSNSGDKGVIEAISDKPLPVIFDKGDKDGMLEGPLFQYAYIIDVQIGYVHEKPANYVVLKTHQRIPKPQK